MRYFASILDDAFSWQLKDLYLSKNHKLIAILEEENPQQKMIDQEKHRLAYVSFHPLIDFKLQPLNAKTKPDQFMYKEENNEENNENRIYGLLLPSLKIHVLTSKKPTILIKAPTAWMLRGLPPG